MGSSPPAQRGSRRLKGCLPGATVSSCASLRTHQPPTGSMDSINSLFGSAVSVRENSVQVTNDKALASDAMDALVRMAVFGSEHERNYARWLIWELGQAVGVRPASIHDLYIARGRGEVSGFTVPAMNV